MGVRAHTTHHTHTHTHTYTHTHTHAILQAAAEQARQSVAFAEEARSRRPHHTVGPRAAPALQQPPPPPHCYLLLPPGIDEEADSASNTSSAAGVAQGSTCAAHGGSVAAVVQHLELPLARLLHSGQPHGTAMRGVQGGGFVDRGQLNLHGVGHGGMQPPKGGAVMELSDIRDQHRVLAPSRLLNCLGGLPSAKLGAVADRYGRKLTG